LLLEAPCGRVEQIRLVNTLCFAQAYAAAQGRWKDRTVNDHLL
jgi:hypothetical protein